MVYDPQNDSMLQKIKNQGYTRVELMKIRENIIRHLKESPSDERGLARLEAIENTELLPAESQYVFMGFCPGATLENRQDTEWLEKGICKFDFVQSEHQLRRFLDIMPGDIVILKKREEFGKTMRIFAHGQVKAAKTSRINLPYLEMDWEKPKEFLEVPLLGCNSTVDVRSLERVESEMPPEFWEWLRRDVD